MWRSIGKLGVFAVIGVVAFASSTWAREVDYDGGEEVVYVTPGEPTQITFPSKIEGGFKRKRSSLNLDRQDNFLVVFAQSDLAVDGEALLVHTEDHRSYAVRIMPAVEEHARDEFVNIKDTRAPDVPYEEDEPEKMTKPIGYAPPTVVSGLMREMIMVAEFGKSRGINGYRRSNRFHGETILHDGALEAKIDEIFMGPNLWGYVINVENLLESSQKLNPATFRLDGTHAVAAERWELAPRPVTAEQQMANVHKGKIYIITKPASR